MNPSAPSDTQVFRAAFWPMFFAMCPLGLGIGLGTGYICQGFWDNDWQRIDWVLMEALTGTVWFLFCAGLFAVVFTLKLSPAGILGHSAWGTRRSLAWPDIIRIKTFRLLNLRYLRLYPADGKKPVWIALFLARPAEFAEMARRLAPPGSPLLDHLP